MTKTAQVCQYSMKQYCVQRSREPAAGASRTLLTKRPSLPSRDPNAGNKADVNRANDYYIGNSRISRRSPLTAALKPGA